MKIKLCVSVRRRISICHNKRYRRYPIQSRFLITNRHVRSLRKKAIERQEKLTKFPLSYTKTQRVYFSSNTCQVKHTKLTHVSFNENIYNELQFLPTVDSEVQCGRSFRGLQYTCRYVDIIKQSTFRMLNLQSRKYTQVLLWPIWRVPRVPRFIDAAV